MDAQNEQDVAYMRQALALARQGLGRVAPNPSVGCLIIKDGRIVGAACTADGGRPHAEEVALDMAGAEAAGADVFITLEPCFQRSSGTPSCARKLADAGVKRVVIAAADPHARYAAGQGPDLLRAAGVVVEEGLLAEEAEALNIGFLTLARTGRPWVGVSGDGAGFDAELTLEPGETQDAALARLGAAGVTRVWERVKPIES